MGLFGTKTCGYKGRAPWGTVKCSKTANHAGLHWARGLSWGADGKVKVGRKSGNR